MVDRYYLELVSYLRINYNSMLHSYPFIIDARGYYLNCSKESEPHHLLSTKLLFYVILATTRVQRWNNPIVVGALTKSE